MTTPITKEQLREYTEKKVKSLTFAITQSAFTGITEGLEKELQLAEYVLAAMDAEPVADVVAWHKEGEERTCDIRWRRFDVAPGPLFAVAQPVAVVLDDGREQFESWMLKKWGRERREYDFVMGKFLHGENYADSYTRHMWTAWSASRAATLLTGNSPVIPDGWVACSERMPKDAQWCAVNTEYGYYVQCWSDGQGWLGDEISIPNCDVTHWIPLPAAPQQEGK